MLKPKNRLTKVRDFNLVMKHGHWSNGNFLDIKVVELAKNEAFFPKKENPETFKKQLRLAISVGLKVSKSAVLRNRARRQISEIVRLLIKNSSVRDGFYVLVTAKKDILKKNYAEISQEVDLLFKRAGLVRKN